MIARYKDQLLIILISGLLFVPFLGASHLFDWDEINFAEASREMLLTGNFTQTQIDFQQFWEKPPLFFWLQSASMRIFGINEFGARFPNAVCGMITLLVLFSIGKKLKGRKFGWLWVCFYACSILPQFYFKSGIIDPWFNLFIFLSIYFFICYLQCGFSIRLLFYSALLAGLAMLTKGPAALLVIGLSFGVYFISVRFKNFIPLQHIAYYLFFLTLPVLPWIAIEIAQNGTWFISEFLQYQMRLATTEDASHGGFPGYHFVVIFFFCFPASVFAIRSLFQKQADDPEIIEFRKWMRILFWVVIILFEIIQTKIAHYSSLAYFPVTFLAAYSIWHTKSKWFRWETVLLIVTGLVFTLLIVLVPVIFLHPSLIASQIKDVFTQKTLQADGNWQGWEPFIAAIILAGLIISIYYNRKEQARKAILFLFMASAITVNAVMNCFTPKIERYSQGAMVDFLLDKSDENCYTDVIGFKSYAHLFYGKRKPSDNRSPQFLQWLHTQHPAVEYTSVEYRKYFSEWLLSGNTDKICYFVTNARKAGQFQTLPQLEQIGEKNGFVFFKREIPQ